MKGYVDRVEIALGAEIVARHRRSYVRGDVVYDPLHYLSLLEKKPGALDQAAPLRGWKLDPAFDTLRRLLEARFTGALLDRITHHVHILEMNGESHRLKQRRSRRRHRPNNPPLDPVGPQAPPTRGPPPAAPRARRPARGALPWTTRTSYHRARGTFLRRRAGTYSRRR